MLLHFDPFLLTTSAELQLAVALLPARLIVRLLGLRLHSVLLRHTTPHHRLRKHGLILLIRGSRLRRLRSSNGHRRFPHSVCVREKDLRRHQSRLIDRNFVSWAFLECDWGKTAHNFHRFSLFVYLA